MNFSWDDIWQSIVVCFVTALLTCIIIYIFHKKSISEYSIKGGENGILKIRVGIDWNIDDEIILDKNITYYEAVRLVDSLNKTLIK